VLGTKVGEDLINGSSETRFKARGNSVVGQAKGKRSEINWGEGGKDLKKEKEVFNTERESEQKITCIASKAKNPQKADKTGKDSRRKRKD